MYLSALLGLAAGIQAVSAATCKTSLQIDDFSQWSKNTNSLGQWTSDDATMTTISAANKVLSFKPKAGAYFYESMPCQAAKTNGYDAVTFSVKGLAGGSFTLEMQTFPSCADTTKYTSYYTQVTGLTGNTQTITIPLSTFAGANLDSIGSFVWWGFSSNTVTWQFSNVAFGCGGSGAVSTSSVRSATPTTVISSSVALSTPAKSSSVVSSSPAPSSSASVRVISSSSVASTLATSASPAPSGCSPLLIDDFISQSRLTFLFYNALDYPTSDDGSATSLTVGKPSSNRLEIVPKDGTYFYTQFPCFKNNPHTGISMRIKAPKGAKLSVELDYSSTCDPMNAKTITVSETDLGWTFDGTERLYLIPFSKFQGLVKDQLVNMLFSGFSGTMYFGPMEFYCGATGEFIPTIATPQPSVTATVPAPAGTAAALTIDKFASPDQNALGFWHGSDEGMVVKYAAGQVTLTSSDSDLAYYSSLSDKCLDWTKYKGSYLHIAYSGSTKFTVSLQQHNKGCNPNVSPFPETWDSAEASRYAKNGHIYIPISHFNIDLTRVVSFAFKGFYTPEPVTFSVIEVVPKVPDGFAIPNKDETGEFLFACKRPNSFAFAIDDGAPNLAQEVLKVIRDAGIHVTFFTVGAPLDDVTTNLTNVYREMQAAGHQLAMHSYTHPKMEGLPDYASIDWEYNKDIAAMQKAFGIKTKYFRPPFGTEGARMRSRLTRAVGNDAKITEWSVDVEDWLWAESSTPEQQKVSFKRDLDNGGNLVVLHYLYPTTVSYLKDFITMAKATGKQLMRVDQCMMDPDAPPL